MVNKTSNKKRDQYRKQRELSDSGFALFGSAGKNKGKNKRDKDFKVVRERKQTVKQIWL